MRSEYVFFWLREATWRSIAGVIILATAEVTVGGAKASMVRPSRYFCTELQFRRTQRLLASWTCGSEIDLRVGCGTDFGNLLSVDFGAEEQELHVRLTAGQMAEGIEEVSADGFVRVVRTAIGVPPGMAV